MFCPNCGSQNDDNAPFCAKCGQSFGGGQSQANNQVPNNQFGVQPPMQAQQFVMPEKNDGPFAAGLKDVIHSQGWFGRVIRLWLLSLFPFLSFIPGGYALRWGADLIQGKNEPLPKKVFNHKAFATGFFYWLISVVCFWITIVLAVCNIVPIIGTVFFVIADVFVAAMGIMAGFRVVLQKRFSAAFDFSVLWEAFKRNPGSLFCSMFLPGLIVYGVVFFIIFIIVLCASFGAVASVNTAASVASLSSLSGYTGSHATSSAHALASVNPVVAIIGMLGPLVILAVLLLIVAVVASSFVNLWTTRAISYWVKENAPEWAMVEPENADKSNPWL